MKRDLRIKKRRFVRSNFALQKLGGFTLIELLVVIAIIGLLASILLVSLVGARNRAKDARIKAEMSELRNKAEIFRDINNYSYANLCSDSDVTTLQTDIVNQGGTNYSCQAVAASYCIELQINSLKWWCIDSAQRSQQYDSNPACAATQTTKACQ